MLSSGIIESAERSSESGDGRKRNDSVSDHNLHEPLTLADVAVFGSTKGEKRKKKKKGKKGRMISTDSEGDLDVLRVTTQIDTLSTDNKQENVQPQVNSREKMFTYAKNLERDGRDDEALRLYLACLVDISDDEDVMSFPSLPVCLHSIADIYYKRDDFQTAVHYIELERTYLESALLDATQIKNNFLPSCDDGDEDRLARGKDLSTLALLCYDQGDTDLALEYYVKAEKEYRKVLGSDDAQVKDIARVISNLQQQLYGKGDIIPTISEGNGIDETCRERLDSLHRPLTLPSTTLEGSGACDAMATPTNCDDAGRLCSEGSGGEVGDLPVSNTTPHTRNERGSDKKKSLEKQGSQGSNISDDVFFSEPNVSGIYPPHSAPATAIWGGPGPITEHFTYDKSCKMSRLSASGGVFPAYQYKQQLHEQHEGDIMSGQIEDDEGNGVDEGKDVDVRNYINEGNDVDLEEENDVLDEDNGVDVENWLGTGGDAEGAGQFVDMPDLVEGDEEGIEEDLMRYEENDEKADKVKEWVEMSSKISRQPPVEREVNNGDVRDKFGFTAADRELIDSVVKGFFITGDIDEMEVEDEDEIMEEDDEIIEDEDDIMEDDDDMIEEEKDENAVKKEGFSIRKSPRGIGRMGKDQKFISRQRRYESYDYVCDDVENKYVDSDDNDIVESSEVGGGGDRRQSIKYLQRQASKQTSEFDIEHKYVDSDSEDEFEDHYLHTCEHKQHGSNTNIYDDDNSNDEEEDDEVDEDDIDEAVEDDIDETDEDDIDETDEDEKDAAEADGVDELAEYGGTDLSFYKNRVQLVPKPVNRGRCVTCILLSSVLFIWICLLSIGLLYVCSYTDACDGLSKLFKPHLSHLNKHLIHLTTTAYGWIMKSFGL